MLCHRSCLIHQPGCLLFTVLALLGQTAHGGLRFTEVTRQTGIRFVHTDGGCGNRYVVETVSAGLALFDYDNDGWLDIYFLNGAPLKGTPVTVPPRHALYHNNGDGTFTDVTEAAGVTNTGYGLGITIGDYDNDGYQDIFLNNYGPKVLYHNNGDGTFTEVTQRAGVVNGIDKVGAGTCFLDIDGDGLLDLYVASYLVFSYATHTPRTLNGFPIYSGPPFFPPMPADLFRNNGDGTFTDISKESGIGSVAGFGMGTVCADFDDDGDTDILVANDMKGNFLWVNDGQGHFTEKGLSSGFAYDINGEEKGSMGVDCGDFDNDGKLDFYVTSYQGQSATLYRNLGKGFLEDVSLVTGAASGTFPHVTWGNSIVDLDNDGYRDIFVVLGHLQDNIEKWNDTGMYLAPKIVLANTGKGKFVNVSNQAGDGVKVKSSSRGAGFDDLDNDGDVDVVILNSRSQPTVLRNDSAPQGHWLQVRLEGRKTNRDGVGARVRVVAGDQTWVDEVHSGRGYQSHYSSRLYFGLGPRDKIDRVEVRWLGGSTEVFDGIKADRLIRLTEGQGRTK
jgi:enediyne biosynthesis protein E4